MAKKRSKMSIKNQTAKSTSVVGHDVSLFVVLPLIDLKNRNNTVEEEEEYQTMLKEARDVLKKEQLQRNVFLTKQDYEDYEIELRFDDHYNGKDSDEYDDESDDEEEEDEMEETNNVELLKQQKGFITIAKDMIENFFEKMSEINIDQIFEFLSKNMGFSFVKDPNFFKNDYLLKYEYRFKFTCNYTQFCNVINNFFTIMNIIRERVIHENIIIEIPSITKMHLMKYIEVHRFPTTSVEMKCKEFSIGSFVNMSKFFQRFSITSDELKIDHICFKINSRFKFVDVLLHLPVEQIILKFVYRTTNIKSITLEKFDTFDRLFFDMNFFTKIYFRNGNWKHFIECSSEYVANWTRIDKIGIMDPEASGPKRTLLKTLYSHEYGLSNAFYVDIPHGKDDIMVDMLISVIDDIRKLDSRHVSLYLSHVQVYQSTIKSSDISDLLQSQSLPFDLYYAYLVLFTNNFKILDIMKDENFLKIFFELIRTSLQETAILAKESHEILEKIHQIEDFIYYLLQQIRDQFLINVKQEFLKNFTALDNVRREMLHSDYHYIRKAIIYPSHIEYRQPMPLLNSRFNKFADPDYTIRVRFYDDNGSLFGEGTLEDRKFAVKLIKMRLLNGLKIMDRHYEFLGSSSSQMREYSATLYAEDTKGRTSKTIRDLNFSNTFQNQSISKYMSRFGLVFSQTICIFNLKSDIKTQVVPDLEGAFKPVSKLNCTVKERYCLSDGIGYMSVEVGDYFYANLPEYHQKGYYPSAYQIRFGGCKGVLTINPQVSGKIIVFRKSMKKYDSPCRRMGILKYSFPRLVYLNRPLLMILDDALNVRKIEFYKFFIDSTHHLSQATTSEHNAIDFMREFSQGYLPWNKIYSSGISVLEEPFLRSILEYLIFFRLDFELKRKSRIAVSPKIGRIAFGVLDDTQTLKPGQIFFQYTHMDDDSNVQIDKTTVLSGLVMVTKFPCMQPGDVRKFHAVNIPKLHHMKDCVVFPAVGDRSHTDEMGGSDMDGDEFAIFWSTNLIFTKQNKPPMDFPYGQGMGVPNKIIENEDLVDFYCKFFENQNIGIAATSHLRLADYHPKGLFSIECEALAVNYNIMLDYAKTGFCQTTNIHYKVPYRPDFMTAGNNCDYYLSKKILGQFFRHCSLVENAIEISQGNFTAKKFSSNCSEEEKQSIMLKNHLTLPGWKYFYEEASDAFQTYKLRIMSILEQSEVKDEAVLFSDVYDDKQESTNLLIKDLFAEFNALFKKQLKKLRIQDQIGKVLLASAWYSICLEKSFMINDKPLLGLPWLIVDELCDLAMYSYSGKFKNKKTDTFRVTVKNGYPKFVRIGVMHNQIVPYDPSNIYQNGLRFQYRFSFHQFYSYQKPNVSLLKYYWNSIMIDEHLRTIDNGPLIWKELMDKATKRIVFNMVFTIIWRLRTEIYDNNRQCRIRYKNLEFNEEPLFKDIVTKLINNVSIKIIQQRQDKNDTAMPTISTLFNISMLYLHNIVNNSHGVIENTFNSFNTDIFLIKYSVFALIFLNRFGFNIDKIFYNFINIDFMEDRYRRIELLKMISSEKNGEMRTKLMEDFISSIIDRQYLFMDNANAIFDDHLQSKLTLRTKEVHFHLLPMNYNFCDSDENSDKLFHHLQMLSGIEFLDISLLHNQVYDETVDKSLSEDEKWKNRFHFVRASGYDHSITILKTLLGNSNFYSKILPFLEITF